MNVNDVMEKVKVHKRRKVWSYLLNKKELRRTSTYMYIDELYSSPFRDKEKTHAFSDTYVNCHPESSWEHLTTLLYQEDEMTAVDQARPFLPPRGM